MSMLLSPIAILIIIFLLILASAFFSSAETALTAASEARMRQLSKRYGNKQAKRVESLRQKREQLITTILIGNNAVNILASSLATSAAIVLTGDSGVVLATIMMIIIIVLFAEVLPKNYALNHADKLSLQIALPVQIIVWILAPLTWALHKTVIKLFSGKSTSVSREDELRGLIDLHNQDTDDNGRETGAMLSSVLDLGEVTVDEIMTHRASVSAINADDDPEDILRFVLKSPHTRHPVYSSKSENIIGVLHVKALLRAIEQNADREIKGLSIRDIATEPYFIPETTQLFAQLQAFRNRREHFAIVIDEYGDLRGIVTLEDILEEIVGDIDDEHDEGLPELKLQSDGSYIADGIITLRDMNRLLNLELPDDKAATLAGLIIYESRRIPSIGQEFRFHGIRYRIRNRSGNQLTSIRLWLDRPHKQPTITKNGT